MTEFTWNHRVITYKDGSVGIHEVHYDDGKPVAMTLEATRVLGDDLDEVRQTLAWMRRALDEPALSEAMFGSEVDK